MRTHTIRERVIGLFLGPLLLSCSATLQRAPAGAEELSRFVLFIREQPDGTVTHSWKRAQELDLSRYRGFAGPLGAPRVIVPAMGWNRDCDKENRECINKCMARPLAPGFGHITSGNRKRGGKEEYCRQECWQAYRDCVELEKLQPQEFTAIDVAIDWVKRHRKTILVGTVITIAGVAFVVVSAGAGVTILAPLVLLATPMDAAVPFVAEVSP